MAKDRRKLLHMHSSILDKQPTPASLEVGEIAVNNAADKEFLSIKNTNDKVVRFSSDGQIISWIERKEVMPYKGYVRGDGGPAVTSGDTPTPDAKGSYGISNDDLLNNKSELVFKLNQVAADLTTKHDKVNGAKDMYNKEVNPTDDYGINDGAGFFIDMSRYAMRDGNPSFSGLSATCRTELSGNTFIKDGANTNPYGTDSGHTFYILTTDVSAHNKTWKEEISAKTEDISGRTTTIGNNGENLHVMGTTTEVHDGNVTITNKSNVTEYTSGATTETKKGVVTETNLSAKTENTSGTSTSNIVVDNIVNVSGETHITTTGNTAIHTESKLGITAVDDILESSEANIAITANSDICETAGGKASFYGVAQTNLGLDCVDSTPSVVTNLYGDTINTDADTANTTIGTAITQVTSANTNISTATTVIGTADTKITSAKTVINTANTSATTATLSGNTLQIRESGYIDYSGNTLTSYTTSNTCIQANTDLNMGGNTNTRIGYNCNGGSGYTNNTYISASNSAFTYSPNIQISGNTTEITGTSNVYVYGNDVCISGVTDASLGAQTVRVGTDCGTNVVATGITAISTKNITLSSATINESGTNEVNIYGGNNVKITSKDVCISGGTDASIGAQTVRVGTDCDGSPIASDVTINSTSSITLTSTTENHTTTNYNLTANTENHNTSSFTVNSTSAACITSDIDATLGGSNRTNIGYDCAGGGITNVTNIYASSSVTINSPTTNITGDTNISGDTIIGGDTNISGDTIIGGNTNISGDTHINKTLIIDKGLQRKLSWTYGTVSSTTGCAQDGATNFSGASSSDDKCFVIPRCVGDMQRQTLKVNYGNVKNLTTDTYDPGVCSGTKEISVPNSIKHLNEWDGNCLVIDGCVQSTGFYQSSDIVLKENVYSADFIKQTDANNVIIKQFNYKSDETKRTVYGVIAQDVESHNLEELVYIDDKGIKSVDYTSLMLLKIAFLENEVIRLSGNIDKLTKRLDELESKK